MQFIKKYLKFIIGIAVIIVAAAVFFRTQQGTESLENATLKQWAAATTERRLAAAQILVASDNNLEIIVACVDKMAKLPDASDMAVSDAVRLCHTGLLLKDNI